MWLNLIACRQAKSQSAGSRKEATSSFRSVVLLTLASCFGPAFASQVIDVEPGDTVNARVSSVHLNQIAMTGGLRLASVWGTDDVVTIDKDETLGRAYVQPISDKPFALFVTDENGDTYTIQMTPTKSMSAQLIQLRPLRSEKESAAGSAPGGGQQPYIASLKALLQQVAQGEIPAGYRLEEDSKSITLWAEADVTLVGRYRGADRNIERYLLTNISGAEMRIEEREFASFGPGIVAVSLTKHVLNPADSGEVFIVRRHIGDNQPVKAKPRTGVRRYSAAM